jgi:hypothetical protein
MIKIVDNFLDFPFEYYQLCKKLNFYNMDDFKEVTGDSNHYPGLRTNFLHKEYPFLYYAILSQIKNKLVPIKNYISIKSHAQLRLDVDSSKDWIHKDYGDTVLIYLSNTNLNSGTAIYETNNGNDFRETAMIKYVQNRAVFFSEGTFHQAINSHGKDINDGRLTLTFFMIQ